MEQLHEDVLLEIFSHLNPNDAANVLKASDQIRMRLSTCNPLFYHFSETLDGRNVNLSTRPPPLQLNVICQGEMTQSILSRNDPAPPRRLTLFGCTANFLSSIKDLNFDTVLHLALLMKHDNDLMRTTDTVDLKLMFCNLSSLEIWSNDDWWHCPLIVASLLKLQRLYLHSAHQRLNIDNLVPPQLHTLLIESCIAPTFEFNNLSWPHLRHLTLNIATTKDSCCAITNFIYACPNLEFLKIPKSIFKQAHNKLLQKLSLQPHLSIVVFDDYTRSDVLSISQANVQLVGKDQELMTICSRSGLFKRAWLTNVLMVVRWDGIEHLTIVDSLFEFASDFIYAPGLHITLKDSAPPIHQLSQFSFENVTIC